MSSLHEREPILWSDLEPVVASLAQLGLGAAEERAHEPLLELQRGGLVGEDALVSKKVCLSGGTITGRS